MLEKIFWGVNLYTRRWAGGCAGGRPHGGGGSGMGVNGRIGGGIGGGLTRIGCVGAGAGIMQPCGRDARDIAYRWIVVGHSLVLPLCYAATYDIGLKDCF